VVLLQLPERMARCVVIPLCGLPIVTFLSQIWAPQYIHLLGFVVFTVLLKIPWSESASELYRPSDRRLSAKRLPTCADRECYVVSVTDPYGRILGFLDRSR
jgi:hypothetical protein